MDLEVCFIDAKDGDTASLVDAVNNGGGGAALASSPWCQKVTAYAGVKNHGSVLLLVEWDSVELHEAAKTSEGFGKFVETISPFLGGAGSVQHFR